MKHDAIQTLFEKIGVTADNYARDDAGAYHLLERSDPQDIESIDYSSAETVRSLTDVFRIDGFLSKTDIDMPFTEKVLQTAESSLVHVLDIPTLTHLSRFYDAYNDSIAKGNPDEHPTKLAHDALNSAFHELYMVTSSNCEAHIENLWNQIGDIIEYAQHNKSVAAEFLDEIMAEVPKHDKKAFRAVFVQNFKAQDPRNISEDVQMYKALRQTAETFAMSSKNHPDKMVYEHLATYARETESYWDTPLDEGIE